MRRWTVWGIVASLLVAGCGTPWLPPTPIVLDRIGPQGAGPRPAPTGYLRAYTATRSVQSGRLPYEVHTPYEIFDETGRQVRTVVNRVGETDQAPMTVALPPGRYQLLAEAAGYGRVTAPVVIAAGMLTEVHLTRDGMPAWEVPPGAEVVRLPEGSIVGLRARETAGPVRGSRQP